MCCGRAKRPRRRDASLEIGNRPNLGPGEGRDPSGSRIIASRMDPGLRRDQNQAPGGPASMRFGEVPVAEAEGAILVHSLRLGTTALKKGRVLGRADVEAIVASGIPAITVARLDPGDVGEDEAAERIAAAAVGSGITAAAPFTGRANLHAAARGL